MDERDALGVTLLQTSQPAGSWANPATRDLVIGHCVGGRGIGRADIGAGRFDTTGRLRETMALAPGAPSSFEIRWPHRILILAVPYAGMTALTQDMGLPADGDFGPLHRGSFEDPLVTALLERLWDESKAQSKLGPLFLEGATLTLAAALLRLASRPPADRRAVGGLAPRLLKRIVERLRASPGAPVSLRELAAEARLSPFHFARAFRHSTGAPPHRYQTALRLDRARELLETTELSVTEIALSVGYESSQSFARAFSRHCGASPSSWRSARR